MHQSKLVVILKSLDKNELNRLHRFLEHPYFAQIKQKQKALELLRYLLPFHPQFDQPALEKSQVYTQIFDKKDYSASKLDKLVNRLLQAVKLFVAWEELRLDERSGEWQLWQARYFRRKNLGIAFQQTIQQARRWRERATRRGQDFYLLEYQLEREAAEFNSLFNQRKEDLNLPQTIEQLDIFYLTAKLEYACSLLAQRKHHIALPGTENEFADIEQMIERRPNLRVPIVEVYYRAFLLLRRGGQEADYLQLLEALRANEHQIPLPQVLAIEAICRSHCIHKYNEGHQQYLGYAFALYKQQLESGHLYYEGGLLAGTFRNVIQIGLKLKDFAWVWQFMEDHQDRLVGTETPEAVYRFNLANYYFAKQDYDLALQHLELDIQDTYYKIAARRLELKIYYEQQSPILDNRIAAFKTFIFRISKKLLSNLARRGNNNFINLLRQVNSTRTLRNTPRIEKLTEKIKRLGAIVEREWLLEKLGELK